MALAIDHLVVAAPDLESGAAHVARTLGVAPAAGGAHPRMGTHNRLLGMAGGIYLEVIAIDPDAPPPQRPRWFGLDSAAMRARLREGPFLAHWVARADAQAGLSEWQARHPDRLAPVIPMTRGELRWRLTVPDDGSLPAWAQDGRAAGDGVFPTLIQWDVRPTPADTLPRAPLSLRRLRAGHPDAALLRAGLDWLGGAGLIELETADVPPWLAAQIETPGGVKTLR